jgi:hypothetical protein
VVQEMWIGLVRLGVGHWSYCEQCDRLEGDLIGGGRREGWVVWALLRQGLGCIIMLVECLLDGPKSRVHIAFILHID